MLLMTKRLFIFYLLFFSITLVGCGGNTASKPTVIDNAESHMNDGLIAYAETDWSRAQWSFTRALSLYQSIDDQQGVLHSLINLAEVALSVRNYSIAQSHLDRAAAIVTTSSLHHYQPRITLLYAVQALKQLQITQAESLLQKILPVFDLAMPVANVDAIQLAAIASRTKLAFIQEQDEELWVQRYAYALNLSANKNPHTEARLLRFQSSLLQRQGGYQESESLLQRALFEYKKNLSRSGIAVTLFELGQLYMTQGRWHDSQEYLQRSIVLFRYLNDIDKIIQVTENLVEVELKLANLERSNALKKRLAELKAERIRRLSR